MKKWFRSVVIFCVILLCSVVIAFVFALPTLERKVRHEIVQTLHEKFDAKVELKSLRVSSMWPLGLKLQGLKITPQAPDYRLEVEEITLRLRYLFGTHLEVLLERPAFVWLAPRADESKPVAVHTEPPAKAKALQGVAYLASMGVELKILGGVIAWKKDEGTDVQLEDLNVVIEKSKLLDESEPIKAKLTSQLRYQTPWLTGKTEISGQTSDLRVTREKAVAQNLELQIGGLAMRANGASNFKQSLHDWIVLVDVDDLARLPKPPDFLPAQNWRGKLQLESAIHVSRERATVQGNVKFEHVGMDLKWESPEVSISGPASLDTMASFKWQPSQYEIDDLILQVNLSDADFRYSNVFHKPPRTPMMLDMRGGISSGSIDLQVLELRLSTLKMDAQGKIPLDGSGKIQFKTSPTALAGWEKLIPPMASTPLKGSLELAGSVFGSFRAPKEMTVDFAKISLQNLSGTIQYKSKDEKLILAGPFAAHVDGRLNVQASNVKSADMKAFVDLGGLLIRDVGVVEKKAGEKLQMNLTMKSQKSDIAISPSTIQLPFGQMGIVGRVHDPFDPVLDLTVDASISNLESVKTYLPMAKEAPLSGSLTTKLTIQGKPGGGKEPWFRLPLKIGGAAHWNAAKFAMPKEEVSVQSAPSASRSAGAAKPPASLLPKGYLTENLNLNLDAGIDKFTQENATGKLEVDGTTVKGRLNHGIFAGDVTTHGFGGQLHLGNLNVPLLASDPKIVSDAHFEGIKIEAMLEFLQPAMKEAAKGPCSGDVHIESALPGAPDFLSRLRAGGKVGSENIWINTLLMEQMINEQMAKIPGVGGGAVKLEPLQGRLLARFQLASQLADPVEIDGFDRGGSELHLKGSASLDKNVNLAGEFRWAKAPLSGCLKEGNADSLGRVVVPISLKGPIASPSWSIATDVITKMGTNALRCEATKALQKNLQEQLPGNLGDELGKKLKGILGQ